MRSAWVGVLVMAAAAAVFLAWLVEKHDDERDLRARQAQRAAESAGLRGSPRTLRDAPVGPEVAAEATGPVADLAAALAENDPARVRAAAAALRGALRSDRGAWEAAARRLLAKDTAPALREALALVLGTVATPDPDALILDALERHGEAPGFARAAYFALSAVREPEDEDDVFDLAGRPHGIEGPGGLGITIGREIEEKAVREAVAAGLRREDPDVRRGAALALRGSLASSDARAAFRSALRVERDDGVAQEVGEGLAESLGRVPDAAEREGLVELLLARAAEAGMDGLRFRVEDDLASREATPAERAALEDLAVPARPFEQRTFALTVLAGSAAAAGGEAEAATRSLLVRLLVQDGDGAVRDLSARLLRRLRPDPAALEALARAAREDREWNVRFAALDAYARLAGPDAAALLDEAAKDPDARVAARARELRDAR